jgi:hypothetical protein
MSSLLLQFTELFTEKSIIFEDRPLDIVKVPIPDSISTPKFGILKLNAITAPLSKENIDIIFMVDRSGSMSDLCSDGRSKMHHICHTLNNMVLYFKDNATIKAHITIHAFDNLIYNIVDRCKINEENINEILFKISHITPKDNTDIELALKDISATTEKIRNENADSEIVSIFMTDGEVSTGKSETGFLCELVDKSICNYFIGFGVEHDAVLLNALGNSNKSSYHFIDKLENSGYVYGEILHEIVYKLLFNVKLEITDGLIYDYKNNLWVSSLYIGNIVSEANKVYHISRSSLKGCRILLTADQKVYDNDREVIMGHGVSIFDEGAVEDLTKYIFRQRTMQLLYAVNTYNNKNNRTRKIMGIFGRNRRSTSNDEDSPNLKDQLNVFLIEMKKYMTENGLENDKLMKNLCDDIYISLRTFGTQFGAMYSSARQTSQGTQRCYTVSHTPEARVDDFVSRLTLTRQTNKVYDNVEDLMLDHFANDISQHQVSGLEDSPFLSPSAAQVMRNISRKDEDKE